MATTSQFAGGPLVSEKPQENFENNDTVKEVNLDGGGMFPKFEEPKDTRNSIVTEAEEDGNPDDILAALDDVDGNIVEASAVVINDTIDPGKDQDEKAEGLEMAEIEGGHCRFGPTIDSCVRPGGLTPEEGQEAKKALAGLEDSADISKALDKADISSAHKTKLTEVVEHLVDPEIKEKNRENFSKDFGPRLEDFKIENGEGEKVFEAITAQTVDRLGGNYFVNLDDSGNSLGRDQALNRAFATCIEEIGEKVQVDENTLKYKEMVNDINDADKSFEVRFKILVELEDYSNTEIVKGGKKNKEDLVAAAKKGIQNNNASEQFQERQRIRLEAENNLNTNDPLLDKMYQAQEAKEKKVAETGAFGDVDKKFEGIQDSVSS